MSAPAPKDSLLRARDCVANVRMLPPLPTVAVDIMSKLGDEFIDGNEVADVVAQDPAICARLISLANSAYFALRTPVCDMREVVNRVLGADTVRSMALALASQRVLDTKDCPAFDIREFWRVALGTAAAAKRIAAVVDEVSPVERDSAYAMGLCHDLGLMALVCLEPVRMQQALEGDPSLAIADRVTECFGFSSAVVTLALAEHWEMPLMMTETYRARVGDKPAEHAMASVLNAAVVAAEYNASAESYDSEEAAELLATGSLNVSGADLAEATQLSEKQREALDGAVEAMTPV